MHYRITYVHRAEKTFPFDVKGYKAERVGCETYTKTRAHAHTYTHARTLAAPAHTLVIAGTREYCLRARTMDGATIAR